MENLLTIIYSDKIDLLLKFKAKTTHWLPEKSGESFMHQFNDIYKPGNVVCTTKHMTIDLIRSLIISDNLDYNKVVWLNVSSDATIAYTFNENGYVIDFFKVN